MITVCGCTDSNKEEEEEGIKITFGTPVITKAFEGYYVWNVDIYSEKDIYEIEVKPTTPDPDPNCTVAYIGHDIIVLSHPVVEGKYVYEISFIIEFVREGQDYSQNYTLTCKV